MATLRDVIEAYGAAWNEPEEQERRRLLERSWADDGTYTDPTAHVARREALVRHIAGFQQQMPGSRVVLTSGVDEHHRMFRFTRRLVGPDGTPMFDGIDFGEVSADGRLQRIVGFFGPSPAAS